MTNNKKILIILIFIIILLLGYALIQHNETISKNTVKNTSNIS